MTILTLDKKQILYFNETTKYYVEDCELFAQTKSNSTPISLGKFNTPTDAINVLNCLWNELRIESKYYEVKLPELFNESDIHEMIKQIQEQNKDKG